jgi:serine/threonine-protein kinase RIO1
VVKRYNLKHWRHALSRLWRPSRAWHSWQAAHRLDYYGIATPRPLALVEERWGVLRGRAFFIAEHCPGVNLLALLDPAREPESVVQQALWELFAILYRLRITHGDLKATNLLWHAGRIVLIDLDALTEHRSQSSFARAWRRDRDRLIRNWPADSALAQWLERVLPGESKWQHALRFTALLQKKDRPARVASE